MYPPVQSSEESWYYVLVFAVSALATNAIFFVFRYLFWDASALRQLSTTQKLTILSMSQSYIHAVVASALATYALYTDTELHDDYVWGKSTIASTTCAITAGYMFGDLLHILRHWKHLGDFQYLVHHVTSSLSYIYVFLVGGYRFFAMVRLLAEYSTVFVNNRATLHLLGMQGGNAYFYNGLLMVFSFTLARMVPLPIYLYCVISVVGTEGYNESGIGRYIVWSSCFFLDFLNLYWYYKMINGAVKVWNKRKTSSPSANGKRFKDIKQG